MWKENQEKIFESNFLKRNEKKILQVQVFERKRGRKFFLCNFPTENEEKKFLKSNFSRENMGKNFLADFWREDDLEIFFHQFPREKQEKKFSWTTFWEITRKKKLWTIFREKNERNIFSGRWFFADKFVFKDCKIVAKTGKSFYQGVDSLFFIQGSNFQAFMA